MGEFKIFALALALCANSLFADRVVTDQLGRDVTLPNEVKRIVVLQHQSLNALNELNALDKVVGVQESWEKSLGKNKKSLNRAANFHILSFCRDRHSCQPTCPCVIIVNSFLI